VIHNLTSKDTAGNVTYGIFLGWTIAGVSTRVRTERACGRNGYGQSCPHREACLSLGAVRSYYDFQPACDTELRAGWCISGVLYKSVGIIPPRSCRLLRTVLNANQHESAAGIFRSRPSCRPGAEMGVLKDFDGVRIRDRNRASGRHPKGNR
jgi:hypothetical protein